MRSSPVRELSRTIQLLAEDVPSLARRVPAQDIAGSLRAQCWVLWGTLSLRGGCTWEQAAWGGTSQLE